MDVICASSLMRKKIKLLHDENTVFKNKNIRISGKNILIKGELFWKSEKELLSK